MPAAEGSPIGTTPVVLSDFRVPSVPVWSVEGSLFISKTMTGLGALSHFPCHHSFPRVLPPLQSSACGVKRRPLSLIPDSVSVLCARPTLLS